MCAERAHALHDRRRFLILTHRTHTRPRLACVCVGVPFTPAVGNAVAALKSAPKVLLLNGYPDRETRGMTAVDYVRVLADALNRSREEPPVARLQPYPACTFVTHLFYVRCAPSVVHCPHRQCRAAAPSDAGRARRSLARAAAGARRFRWTRTSCAGCRSSRWKSWRTRPFGMRPSRYTTKWTSCEPFATLHGSTAHVHRNKVQLSLVRDSARHTRFYIQLSGNQTLRLPLCPSTVV